MDIQIITKSTFMTFEREFRQLNEAWISKYFELEDSDKEVLSNPQKFILDKGGNVFIALYDKRAVGCCALLVHDIFTCELAKMAVDPSFQGKSIGFQLGNELIKKAQKRGFKRIVLEANSKMTASIALYHKLGFKEVPIFKIKYSTSLHSRCNVFMELVLEEPTQPEYFL